MASKKPTPDQSTHDPEVRPKAARTHWREGNDLKQICNGQTPFAHPE